MKGIKDLIKYTDWILLIFLFLVANHAVFTLKLMGMAFIFIMRPNFKFGFFKGRIPQFYLYIVVLALINLLIHIQDFSYEYMVAFAVGNSFWIFGLLIHHQLRLSIEKYGDISVINTMRSFVLVNLFFCLWQAIRIAFITHTYNPFTGLPFPYGMSTGDKIYGFFMESSYYNMMVSAMVTVYFLFKRDLLFSVLSIICMLMVFGNIGTIAFWGVITCAVLASLLGAALQDRKPGCIRQVISNITLPRQGLKGISLLLIVTAFFYLVVSPENIKYLRQSLNKKATIAKIIDIEVQKDKIALTQNAIHNLAGKKLAFKETNDYLQSSPLAFFLGAGTTRFSSFTAQRMSGLDSSRLFLNVLPQYRSPLYRNNHMLITEYRLKGEDAELSNANWPDSFYNQIFGEYGILGFILFLVFYVWYFVKDIRYWTYSFWISLMLFPFALISYMFEPLCIMVFFEFLVAADIVNNKKLANAN